ncbi:Phosphatidate cytidylyltransferase [Candidatus Phytoplasma australiense]|uniref:Phosphatidate cytidylyltransferase n=1 Tax=Phytoplasma australiense TaxID=59748 RepID=B1VA76_PHYAS|nr:Phosphatidate cytidylyltransferase [Candidatus Phytoplasma australiense]
MNSIKKRIITGMSLVLFSFFFYFLLDEEPKIAFLFFCGLTIVATQEMLIIFNKDKTKIKSGIDFNKKIAIILLTLFSFIIFSIFLFPKEKSFFVFLGSLEEFLLPKEKSFFLLFAPFFLLLFVFVFFTSWNTSDLAKAFLIMLYIGVGMSSFFALVLKPINQLLFFVLIVTLTDSFAFLARFPRFFPFLNLGPLAPHLSPKKTKKGAILGTFGSVIATFIFFLICRKIERYFLFIFFAFLISLISQISDLLASKFKREFVIKDFGNIFPGHGGFLDRFDSWILTSFFSLFFFSAFQFLKT